MYRPNFYVNIERPYWILILIKEPDIADFGLEFAFGQLFGYRLGFLAFSGLGMELVSGEHSQTLIYISYVLATSSTFLPEVFNPRTDK